MFRRGGTGSPFALQLGTDQRPRCVFQEHASPESLSFEVFWLRRSYTWRVVMLQYRFLTTKTPCYFIFELQIAASHLPRIKGRMYTISSPGSSFLSARVILNRKKLRIGTEGFPIDFISNVSLLHPTKCKQIWGTYGVRQRDIQESGIITLPFSWTPLTLREL